MRTVRPLRIMVGSTVDGGGGAGSAKVTVGASGSGGVISTSEMEKSIFSGGVDALTTSQGSIKAGGRSGDIAMGGVFGCGRGISLLTRSWTDGGTSFSLALICQTELNLASALQVTNASSYKK